jgi:hypothetical protein
MYGLIRKMKWNAVGTVYELETISELGRSLSIEYLCYLSNCVCFGIPKGLFALIPTHPELFKIPQ